MIPTTYSTVVGEMLFRKRKEGRGNQENRRSGPRNMTNQKKWMPEQQRIKPSHHQSSGLTMAIAMHERSRCPSGKGSSFRIRSCHPRNSRNCRRRNRIRRDPSTLG
ncbi:unnamed protein product, partial [Mesorhabditis belari]|uniref:Uncharacterized protein n=1 Tax=Mesorhabditis belari TaxID=2138241 RepID=A0AAF3EWW1_9BILA